MDFEQQAASMADTATILELRNASKQFGGQHVLRNVNLTVERGKTLVVIGESGCGKSVTMKLLIGLLQPTHGEALLEGRPLSDRSEQEIAKERQRFGYLFQGAALFDSLNVYENVAFPLRQNMSLPEEKVRTAVVERLAEVGLPASVCEKKPEELSGGMKKRVGLARALALVPEIMMYDEPTTGLDPIMSDVINNLIHQTRVRRRVTSIVVTHDMTTVRKVADRVVMFYPHSRLDSGEPQIIFEGTAEEVFACEDPRVYQFVHGQAGERMREMAVA